MTAVCVLPLVSQEERDHVLMQHAAAHFYEVVSI